MSAIQNVGAKYGRRVTWVGATGDSTFIRLEASLISQKILKKSTVTANLSSISKEQTFLQTFVHVYAISISETFADFILFSLDCSDNSTS